MKFEYGKSRMPTHRSFNLIILLTLVAGGCGTPLPPTANPVQALVAQSDQGRGVLGVVDGLSPRGREQDQARGERREFLRRLGYKR